jgi:hypothetical protein
LLSYLYANEGSVEGYAKDFQEGLSLKPGKHGPHLTQTKPDEILPEGLKLPSGGVVSYRRGKKPRISFYGSTMADFAAHPLQHHQATLLAGLPLRAGIGLRRQRAGTDEYRIGIQRVLQPNRLRHADLTTCVMANAFAHSLPASTAS